jgi:hypothetical protein
MLPHSLVDYSNYCSNYGKEYDEVMGEGTADATISSKTL